MLNLSFLIALPCSKKTWRTSHQVLKPDHLIFFPSCSSSMKRIHLVWLNVSEMCLTPKLLAVIQASFLQPWMTSEFKCSPSLEGNFMVKNQIVLNSLWEDRLLSKSVSVLQSCYVRPLPQTHISTHLLGHIILSPECWQESWIT